MERIDRRRARALASERRAGSWLHRTAVERQYRYLRENRRVLGIFAVVYAAVLPLIWLQAEWLRGFLLGGWTATVVWLVVLLTFQMSGVAHLQQGELAEQWTVQELQPLTKSGRWRLINHVLFRPWDIDHVLLGPAGVVIVETKGGNSDWTEPRHAPRIRDAARQALDNAGDTRRFLRPEIGGAPVHAVVALWPSRESVPTQHIDGVTVLSGHRLREWVEALPDHELDDSAANAAWQRIADHLERRDAHDLETHGRAPRRLGQLVLDLVQYPVGFLVGGALVSSLAGAVGFPAASVAMLGVLGVLVLTTRRVPTLRHFAGGVGLAITIVIAGMAGAVVADQFL